MNEIFLIFISLSLSGSLIALLLFLLKPVIKERLSKTWQYYIYLVVIVRLLLPFGPEISVISMIFHQVENFSVTENNADLIPDTYNLQTSPSETQYIQPEENAVIPPPAANNTGNLIAGWIWLAWLIPAVVLLFRKVFGFHKYTRSVKKECQKIEYPHMLNLYRNTCTKMGVKYFPGLVKNDQIAAPMLVGLFQPVIILPDTDLKDAELQYVFQHELTHYKRIDIVYKWLVQIAVCIHWYNPLVYWVSREVNRNCELSCDEAVIRRLDGADRYTYGDMLLETIKLDKRHPASFVSIALSKDTKLIKERLGAIKKYRKKSKIVYTVSALLAVLIMCCAIFSGVYANRKPSASPAPVTTESMQTVVYEKVDLLRNEGNGDFDHITNVRANNTTKKIVSCDRSMIAFDQEGNPLELDWWAKDDYLSRHFLWTHSGLTSEILPGQKDEQTGGWKLNATLDPEVSKIAYILYCDVEITFEDGTVWKNPNYEQWVSTYEGKKADVSILENYYPYEQKITF